MGCGNSTAGSKDSKQIEKFLQDEKRRLDEEIKLLLLGAGESGKSTIAKQMKILHLNGFSDKERMSYRNIIYQNVLSNMKAVVIAAREMKLTLDNNDNYDAANRIETYEQDPQYYNGGLSSEVATDLKELWNDKGIRSAYDRRSEFQLPDSAAYYFDEIDELANPDYIPTVPDILHCRVKTCGITEMDFAVDRTKFKMVDVGGQRTERRKWIHCFQDVTAVLFCVALSEYDQTLIEDNKTNRMHESLKLFSDICKSRWFANSSMILFLNKKDLFAEKIQRVNLNICFPEYNGGLNYENGIKYVEMQFKALREEAEKPIYTHTTCAIDSNNIQFVFNSVKDTIVRTVLRSAGIY